MPFKNRTLVYRYIFTTEWVPPSGVSIIDIGITMFSSMKENIKEGIGAGQGVEVEVGQGVEVGAGQGADIDAGYEIDVEEAGG